MTHRTNQTNQKDQANQKEHKDLASKAHSEEHADADADANGIPANITVDFARDWMSTRVSDRRFKHVEGVAYTARQLAKRSGCSTIEAELAGWLHDCCKEVNDKELIVRARAFGLPLHPVEELNGHLLHGPVGACTVKSELGLTNQHILDAISQHTLGEINMSVLAKVVFLADCLEPTRAADYTKPIWHALKGESQEHYQQLPEKDALDLDMAILISCETGLRDLLNIGRLIHPKTVDVRNYYLQIIQKRAKN